MPVFFAGRYKNYCSGVTLYSWFLVAAVPLPSLNMRICLVEWVWSLLLGPRSNLTLTT